MKFRPIAIGAAALLVFASPTLAHHSTAMFDSKREVTLVGAVTEYQWTNPHVFIELDGRERGSKAHYSVEGGATRTMEKFGWKARTLKPGDQVTLVIKPMRNGTNGGLLVKAVFPDGRTLDYDPN
jgi:hypothetical protein